IAHNVGTHVRCHGDRQTYRLEVSRLEDALAQRPPLSVAPLGPLPAGDPERRARIRAFSRETYGRPRAEVEWEILARLAPPSQAPPSQDGRRRGIDVDEE